LLKRLLSAAIAAASLFLANAAYAQHHGHENYTPIPAQATPVQGHEDCVENYSLKLGDKGYMHCRDHKYMQMVFTSGNCYCHNGQCRATDWKADPRSPVGLAFKIDGVYCPVKSYLDPHKVKIPDELRTEPGYVCIEDSAPRDADGCPPMTDINCTIWNEGY
jgi:hypothetical protein